MKLKAKQAGFDEVGGRVVHRCDTSVLPHAKVTRLDQETTCYECPLCGASVTTQMDAEDFPNEEAAALGQSRAPGEDPAFTIGF